DNDGNVALVTKPTLIPMEGGEVVKNTEETKALFEHIRNLTPADFNFSKIMQPLSSMVQMPSFNYATDINHSGPEPTPVVQHITLTLPNVTNNSGAEYIMKELRRLPLDAYQYSHRRNK
ncbi:MAG: hypothetical protein K2G20_10575, partial [Lachnospiraceae bacterium]|nr:hypothetical protein [Lachnospiraceae bacterium]